MVRHLSIPLINRFVLTHRQLAKFLKNKKFTPILDYITEFSDQTQKTTDIITKTIKKHPQNFMAIKLSALGLNSGDENISQINVDNIIKVAQENNTRIMIDAETSALQPKINRITDYMIEKYNINNQPIVFKTYQMYRQDSYSFLYNDINKYGSKLGVKLVRGAYWNQENQNGELHISKKETDTDYDMASRLLIKELPIQNTVFATHNHYNIDTIINLTKDQKPNIACLLGMNDKKVDEINEKAHIFRYVPFGSLSDSLPYLMRRLYENLEIMKYLSK